MAISFRYPSNLSSNTYFSGQVKALADQSLASAGTQDGWIIGLPRKNLPHAIGKMLYRQSIILWIKAILVPSFAKRSAIIEVDMSSIGLALVSVAAHVMAIIEHLEITVFLDNPGALFPHERAQNTGGVFIVIIGCENIANIMQEC
jgi:hypothetical protein